MPRWLLSFALALALAAPAVASTYNAELPPQTDRARAEQLLASAPESSARLVRRFIAGQGWCWVVSVDGLPDLDAARGVAGKLAASGAPSTIYKRDGDDIAMVEVVSKPGASPTNSNAAVDNSETKNAKAAPPPPTAAPVSAVSTAAAPTAERHRRGSPEAQAAEVLDAAVRAHGGRSGGLERLSEASSVQFGFIRTIPGDGGSQMVVEHRYLSQGGALRLDVHITEGEGQDSSTVVSAGGRAWVSVAGAATDRDGARAREVVARFSPTVIMAVPFGLPEDVEAAGAWRGMRLVGTQEESGAPRVVLASLQPSQEGLISAAFDPETHTLSRVTWSSEAGQLTFTYDDYHTLDRRLVVPFHARVERDGVLVEEVRVQDLTLDQPIDPALFNSPS